MFNYSQNSNFSYNELLFNNLYIKKIVFLQNNNFYYINLNTIILLNIIILVFIILFKLINSNSIINTIVNLNFIQNNDLKNLIIPIIIFNFLLIINNLIFFKLINIYNMLITLFIFFQPVIIIPFIYIFIFNTSALLCIGLTQKKTVFGVLVNDYIILTSFLLRFFSQYIRIILTLSVFLLLYEYLNTSLLFFLQNMKNNSTLTINSLFLQIIRVLFEVIDCFFILSIQFNMLFIILIWLLSFLFILKFNNVFER